MLRECDCYRVSRCIHTKQAGSIGAISDFYFGDALFEFWPGHLTILTTKVRRSFPSVPLRPRGSVQQ
jgi:hypothetical protein